MKRTPTTKDLALLHQLHKSGQLILEPEFQRNSIWPRAAKAYLIDTILNDKPVPLIFLQRARSAESGKQTYYIIDGQQRLRAIFEFLEDKFRLTETRGRLHNKLYSDLPGRAQAQIDNYDLMVDELFGYSQKDLRDIFVRMNKYVLKAVPQEIRHAQRPGAFADFITSLTKLDYWKTFRTFTRAQLRRMRLAEFCAELVVLIIEGPQDKKASVDLYYGSYDRRFPSAKHARKTLVRHLQWIADHIPDIADTFLRKPVAFYGLVGALNELDAQRSRLKWIKAQDLADRIRAFEKALGARAPIDEAARYLEASSRQTDNLRPRQTRIEIVKKLLTDKL